MTVSEVSRWKSVLKSLVEIIARESAEANNLKLGEDAPLHEETARDQHWRFCELCILPEPEGSAHTADKKCTYTDMLFNSLLPNSVDLQLICGSSLIYKLLAIFAF